MSSVPAHILQKIILLMKVFMITDTHFGIYLNNLDKWQNMMESTFYEFVIPFLEKNAKEGDILIHLGDLFDNRTSIPIITLNKVEKILKKLSEILPIHMIVGNHDLFNKGSNEVNSVRLFSYLSKNIHVYETTHILNFNGKKLILMPWVEKRVDMIKELKSHTGDYLFCHSDLNGCRMHLNSVAHRNADKIDVDEFKYFRKVFSGHVHIRQINENFEFIGSLYQMDRNDMGDQKGITILDIDSGEITFEPNNFSPVFKKFRVTNEQDIEKIDEIKDTKDYIDLVISNNLLINNRKLRRKLEIILEKGNFASVEYIDDITRELIDSEDDSENLTISQEENTMEISISLDYEDYVKEYILKQKYDNDKFKDGVLQEYEQIIKIYKDNFTINKND
jgi:DNA repair exonuclease SbcCD nuclease subunit